MQPLEEIQAKSSEGEPEEKEEQNQESVQTKLTVGAPGDKYEQEADSMAAKVMRMPDSAIQQPIQRQTGEETEAVQMQPEVNSITPLVQRESGEGEEVQMKSGLQRASDGSSVASGSVENQLAGSKGGGSALPDDVRSFMEPRFGADFSSVRVHTDSNAVQMNKELGAQAFAHGSDIYYGAGKSPGKDELTAHELTHTVQQTGGVQAKLQTPSEAPSETAPTKTDFPGNGKTQAVEAGSTKTKTESSEVETTNQEQSSHNTEKQAEAQQNGQGEKEKQAQPGKPQLAVSVENASSEGKPAQGVETSSEAKAETGTNSAKQAVQAVNPQQVKLPSEVQAGEGKQTKGGEQSTGKDGKGQAEGKALEQVPQAQALQQATAQNKAASPKPEGKGEATNPEAEVQNQQATAAAEQGKAQLETTNTQAQQLASAGVNFAPPEEEQAGQVADGPDIAMKAETSGGDAAAL